MRDILMVMSDQHAWTASGFGGGEACTPNLDRIAGEGCLWERCYCSAPLCVPSRMSFLSGLLPSELGIFGNDAALPSDVPTIAHRLGALGYRTVLIGRMHFKGDDQRHGFDERLVGDITSQYWGTGGMQRTDFGAFAGTTNRKRCLEAVGGGYSPVMAYDRMVLEAAEAYLDRLDREEEAGAGRPPVFLIAGFYAPHFPFVCSPERYARYKGQMADAPGEPELSALPEYGDYLQEFTEEKRRHCRAAYLGMAEELDSAVGRLYDRFSELERRTGRPHAFLYASDHGEQLGKRGIFGKQTLYEDAVRVPLLMAGTGIPAGVRKTVPVSLLDVSEGLCEMAREDAGVPSALEEPGQPPVIQQVVERNGGLLMGEAVVDGDLKTIRIGKRILTYDLSRDPDETEDISASRPDAVSRALPRLLAGPEIEWLLDRERRRRAGHRQLGAWGRAKRPREDASVPIPEEARRQPTE